MPLNFNPLLLPLPSFPKIINIYLKILPQITILIITSKILYMQILTLISQISHYWSYIKPNMLLQTIMNIINKIKNCKNLRPPLLIILMPLKKDNFSEISQNQTTKYRYKIMKIVVLLNLIMYWEVKVKMRIKILV